MWTVSWLCPAGTPTAVLPLAKARSFRDPISSRGRAMARDKELFLGKTTGHLLTGPFTGWQVRAMMPNGWPKVKA